ncbi:hypothetical protein [Deinococcus frigens]|uniref:hypothetical protein n=1 Tax=Deinococcus frigens TaxID=249403 RepID=UPI0012EC6D60|nr:hypothetical protein [Deinococcus frigens]
MRTEVGAFQALTGAGQLRERSRRLRVITRELAVLVHGPDAELHGLLLPLSERAAALDAEAERLAHRAEP